MLSKRIFAVAFLWTMFMLPLPAGASSTRQQASIELGWYDQAIGWAMTNGLNLIAGSACGAIATAIVAFKLRANGLPVQNARLIAQMLQAAQNGQAISFAPLQHFANTVRAAHESGIPLNQDGTFAVDWWRLDEATKRLFVAALKRISGQNE